MSFDWGFRISIFNMFPGDADAGGPRNTLGGSLH